MTDLMTAEQLEAVQAQHRGEHWCTPGGEWWSPVKEESDCQPWLLADTALAALKRANDAQVMREAFEGACADLAQARTAEVAALRKALAIMAESAETAKARADEAETRMQQIRTAAMRELSSLPPNTRTVLGLNYRSAALDGDQPALAEAKLVRVNAAMRLLIDSGDATPQAARIIKQIVDQP
jgi:hypothetical protein